MIDIPCSCGEMNHAEESLIGKSLRCTCGAILRIERGGLVPPVSSGLPQEVERVSGPSEGDISTSRRANWSLAGVSSDTWIAGGIAAAIGTLLFLVWLSLGPSQPERASTASFNTQKPRPPSPRPGPQVPESGALSPIKPNSQKLTPDFEPAPPTKSCAGKAERPANGDPIEPDDGTSGSGRSKIEVTNGLTVDAAARLQINSSERTSRFVYIRAKDFYTMEGIEPGTYSLLFASGSGWIAKSDCFQDHEDIREFEEPLKVEESTDSRTSYRITINPVPHGNARTKKIDRKRFLRGN